MSNYHKYPRTFHLPWSEGVQSDDKTMKNVHWFDGREVVVTVKMDGENTTLYQDHTHARSVDSANHESRNWVKNFWSGIRYQIPVGWRVCGENMFARHSIFYDDLPSYFLGFSVWNEKNICLSWHKTQSWFQALGIHSTEMLYYGKYDEELIRMVGADAMKNGAEGYVIRPVDSFPYDGFCERVAKCVRKDHVQTNKHWRSQVIVPNQLRKKS